MLLLLQLFVVDNCIDDWRIAMSARRVLQLALELAVCSLHPPPFAFYFQWRPVYVQPDYPLDHVDDHSIPSRLVPVDALLALPMFLRLYLVCRYATMGRSRLGVISVLFFGSVSMKYHCWRWRLGSKGPPIGNGLWRDEWSRDLLTSFS